MTIGEDATSFGRTTENTVAFPDNSNISRHHADIEFKDGKYVVTDLGSSNGTTINGQPISGETALNNGDFITLGNSVIVEFIIEDETPENAAEDGAETVAAQSLAEAQTSDQASKSKFPVMLGVTGALCGLAVVMAVAAGYMFLRDGGNAGCDATARIVSPVNGETLSQPTEVRVEINNSVCVGKVHIVLNDKSIAEPSGEPYTAQIDPNNFPELADGGLYPLKVVLEDGQGNVLPQTREIALQFETKQIRKTPTPPETTATPTPTIAQGKQPTLIETQKMTASVVGKFTGSFRYNLSNPDFLKEVQKRTAEYAAAEGYYGRAAAFKDTIDQEFVTEKALDGSLPYLLAMSRSKFTLDKQGANEGLWQISNDFATANLYFAACETPNLSDQTQVCSAKVTALYMKNLVDKIFDGDIVFAVAAFGKTEQEANEWKLSLPADRADFWKVITDTTQREQLARFFAAAIVAENPTRFGLKKDSAISGLYPPVGK